MSAGWIKFHRKMLDWEWYEDANVFRLFTHLLLTANYKSSRFRGHTVPPGSLVTGRISLSEQTGLTQQQVRTALNKLKSTSEITIKTTNKFSIISIACWDKYQHDEGEMTSKTTNHQPTSNQQVTTSKEGKKVRRDKGTRLPEDWEPSQTDLNYAISKGFQSEQVTLIAERFKNYWVAKPGAGGVKLDWPATWKNWVLSDYNQASNQKANRRIR